MTAKKDAPSDSRENKNNLDENIKVENNKNGQKPGEKFHPPLLIDLVISISGMVTILVTLIVAVISYLSGTTWLNMFIRTVVTISVVGCVFWLFSLKVAVGALEAVPRSVDGGEQAQSIKNKNSVAD